MDSNRMLVTLTVGEFKSLIAELLDTPLTDARDSMIERALTTEDMAAAFDSSTKTIQALCRNGRIPGAFKTRIGWRVSVNNWREFLDGQKTRSYLSTRKLKGDH
jgi:hypothetical protein